MAASLSKFLYMGLAPYHEVIYYISMTNKSSALTIRLSQPDKEAVALAGVTVIPMTNVRLDQSHFDAIDRIVEVKSDPGNLLTRAAAVRIALHAFCADLSARNGGRYGSFTDLVKDSVTWYADGLG
jgi:hypothetical protein